MSRGSRLTGCTVEPAVLDVADTDALRAAIDGAAGAIGRLDALFANAGISGGRGTLVRRQARSISSTSRRSRSRSMST